jgi:hypothetical protein
MPAFIYTYENGPEVVNMWGVEYNKTTPTEAPENRVEDLRIHPHFEEVVAAVPTVATRTATTTKKKV